MFTSIYWIMTAVLAISSPAFSPNDKIPAKYTCDGAGVSPALHIGGLPAGTSALAIIVHDPDAPHPGGVTHWIAWNIPPMADIPEGFTAAKDGYGVEGKNSKGKTAYMGPCPPNGSHHYHFYVYALDTKLDLDLASTTKESLEKAMQGHILAQGELVGMYR